MIVCGGGRVAPLRLACMTAITDDSAIEGEPLQRTRA